MCNNLIYYMTVMFIPYYFFFLYSFFALFTTLLNLTNQFRRNPQGGGKFMKKQIVIHPTVARSNKRNPYEILKKLCSWRKNLFHDLNPEPMPFWSSCSTIQTNQSTSRLQSRAELTDNSKHRNIEYKKITLKRRRQRTTQHKKEIERH